MLLDELEVSNGGYANDPFKFDDDFDARAFVGEISSPIRFRKAVIFRGRKMKKMVAAQELEGKRKKSVAGQELEEKRGKRVVAQEEESDGVVQEILRINFPLLFEWVRSTQIIYIFDKFVLELMLVEFCVGYYKCWLPDEGNIPVESVSHWTLVYGRNVRRE